MSFVALPLAILAGCASDDGRSNDSGPDIALPGSGPDQPRSPQSGSADVDGDPSDPSGSGSGGASSADDPDQSMPTHLAVRLVPQSGISGRQRVNFAVPLPHALLDAPDVSVWQNGTELPIASRVLAQYRDGSLRSIQIQADVDIAGEMVLDVQIGIAARAPALSLDTVESTLKTADGQAGPKVWSLLPADWLSRSGVAGPQVPEAGVSGPDLGRWSQICDYSRYDVNSFVSQMSDPAVWLYDRGTTAYRGYARRGDLLTLETAYRETAVYRSGITGTGEATRIGVPDKASDLKYHYTQNLAIHYLLSGDDRFRESAEDVAARARTLWPDPGYAGGTDTWTERNAGFALLAYVWTEIVSDDKADQFAALADSAVSAYLSMQDTYPIGYSDAEARCFAHDGRAHLETFAYFGCSPWMSAILADALDGYARERSGTQRQSAEQSIVKLGRMIAEGGRDATGRPLYWMGVATTQNEPDDYEEHWGESAYIVAMAWHYAGKNDAALSQATEQLLQGFATKGVAPHMRSFNWQCRSAVATPYYFR